MITRFPSFRSMQGKLILLVVGLVVTATLLVGYSGMRQLNRFGEANTEKIR